MSMMSGMVGADMMSNGSGPKTEFQFQDIDQENKRQSAMDNVDVVNPKQIKFIKKR